MIQTLTLYYVHVQKGEVLHPNYQLFSNEEKNLQFIDSYASCHNVRNHGIIMQR